MKAHIEIKCSGHIYFLSIPKWISLRILQNKHSTDLIVIYNLLQVANSVLVYPWAFILKAQLEKCGDNSIPCLEQAIYAITYLTTSLWARSINLLDNLKSLYSHSIHFLMLKPIIGFILCDQWSRHIPHWVNTLILVFKYYRSSKIVTEKTLNSFFPNYCEHFTSFFSFL